MFDTDTFEERAAIMEFCGGLSRFDAETQAAKAQGLTRWQALMEVRNADGTRNSEQGGDNRQADNGNAAHDMSRVQRGPKEQIRPLPERDVHGGGCAVALLALRVSGNKGIEG